MTKDKEKNDSGISLIDDNDNLISKEISPLSYTRFSSKEMNDLSKLCDLSTQIDDIKNNYLETEEMKNCFENISNFIRVQKSIICEYLKPKKNDNVEILIPSVQGSLKRKSDSTDTKNKNKRKKINIVDDFEDLIEDDNSTLSNISSLFSDSELEDLDSDYSSSYDSFFEDDEVITIKNPTTKSKSKSKSKFISIPKNKSKTKKSSKTSNTEKRSKNSSNNTSKSSTPPKLYTADELQSIKNKTIYNIHFKNLFKNHSRLTYKKN
ncbi:hypothetical protein BCR32DRAFT_250467 [Anaeromyces robustus]|uniref:Uncharacterized protein n=1 Tax=Anaeromyces robustus TaxID=1754192 RepID=A0A1Y1W0D3_9FUNG|nr:hypothetical protein BCR32DRAFT_250467 [Anaeromyces robustus]|eukprot:ORX66980.1 hypothetical protein BCR32DRAFT_250467 [Anaeromyces robustus]